MRCSGGMVVFQIAALSYGENSNFFLSRDR